MASRTVRVDRLAEAVRDSSGTLALLGDQGGVSVITGDITPSGLVPGTVSVETEHGTIYLDAEGEVETVSVES